jgi:predicted Zn-dependent protease
MRYSVSLIIALAAALLAGCATVTNPVTGQRELTVMDERSEIAEGRKAHGEVLKEYGVYASPRLQAYVNELGQRLAKQSHRSNLEWHFTVLDSPEINAFALPGGYVYVTRGLMAYMESEADLAGVIGHEIGHVTARHGAQRATRQQTAGLGVIAATVLGAVLEAKGVSGATDIASTLSQGAAAGYIASYSRDQETQADQLGAEYLARNNYDPKNMIDVIRVLKSQEQYAADTARAEGRMPPAGAGWLASHPSNDKRLQDIARFAAQYKGKYGDEGRARYLQAIDGMTFGESREQGVTRGRHFYHEPLGIALTAPEGWRVQNSHEAVALVNGAGDAGLIMQVLPPKAGNTHDEIIRNVFRLEQGRTERLALGGFPATHFAGIARNRQGQAQAVEATVATGPGNRHFLLFYGARDAQALARARGQLREAEASFRALTAADRAAARPWTLKTVLYQRGALGQLARQSPLTGNAEAQLRLINGVYSGGEPPPGQLIKVVE